MSEKSPEDFSNLLRKDGLFIAEKTVMVASLPVMADDGNCRHSNQPSRQQHVDMFFLGVLLNDVIGEAYRCSYNNET